MEIKRNSKERQEKRKEAESTMEEEEKQPDQEALETVEGLPAYVRKKSYRQALGLPGEKTEIYHLLAQGEYNRNFWFIHPLTGKKLVLRVNYGSQMHLDNQILYEYNALKELNGCGRTPEPLYADGSLRDLNHGIMVMEYLPGGPLQYRRTGDLEKAAWILADIHAKKLSRPEILIRSEHPLTEMLDECEQMQRVYQESPLGSASVKRLIRECLDRGHKAAEQMEQDIPYRCCINTELNNTNFLIDPESDSAPFLECSLIDWEKPLYGDPAQDLGHFLAPTTTFWKTDVILNEAEKQSFLHAYGQAVRDRFPAEGIEERAEIFSRITCLRGITWCAMAWVQYRQQDKGLQNASTAAKLDAYVDPEFIEKYGLLEV